MVNLALDIISHSIPTLHCMKESFMLLRKHNYLQIFIKGVSFED